MKYVFMFCALYTKTEYFSKKNKKLQSVMKKTNFTFPTFLKSLRAMQFWDSGSCSADKIALETTPILKITKSQILPDCVTY